MIILVIIGGKGLRWDSIALHGLYYLFFVHLIMLIIIINVRGFTDYLTLHNII